MGDKTGVEWADASWSPVTGCTPVSPGCDHCYAERMSKRLRGRCGYPADDPFRVTLHPNRLDQPLRWRKPRRIFVCSMGDLFHDGVPFEYIAAVFGVMATASQHTFLVLTKRPDRMRDFFLKSTDLVWPLPSVWIGVTAEDQKRADERIPYLEEIPYARAFLSYEPALGPLDIRKWLVQFRCARCNCYSMQSRDVCPECGSFSAGHQHFSPVFDWVIVGGESGPGARPMKPEWARDLRDQCRSAGVPFFMKQMSKKAPIPDDLMIREIPK